MSLQWAGYRNGTVPIGAGSGLGRGLGDWNCEQVNPRLGILTKLGSTKGP
jgi:hypothetical protein